MQDSDNHNVFILTGGWFFANIPRNYGVGFLHLPILFILQLTEYSALRMSLPCTDMVVRCVFRRPCCCSERGGEDEM